MTSSKLIVVVVDISVVPLNVTDQEIPPSSPDSVNVTKYFVGGGGAITVKLNTVKM